MKLYLQNKVIALGAAVVSVCAYQLDWDGKLQAGIMAVIAATAALLGKE
jgi:hypothetical protein